MDFGNISENLPIIVLVIGFILLQFFLRQRRKPEIAQQEIVQNLLSEVRLDRALVEIFSLRQKPKRFETVRWQMSKTKLDFLDQALQVALTGAFTMAEDFNRQIDAAQKYKSASYLVGIDVAKLKEPLTKSQQGLEEWLMAKTGTKEPFSKYPGIFDGWFGRG